jgi:hypothetical protein
VLAPGLEPLGRDPIEDAQSLTAVYAETLLNPGFSFRDDTNYRLYSTVRRMTGERLATV